MSELKCEMCGQPMLPDHDVLYRGDDPCQHSTADDCVDACRDEITRLISERDEAREAAPWLYAKAIFGVNKEAAEKWQWLEEQS